MSLILTGKSIKASCFDEVVPELKSSSKGFKRVLFALGIKENMI